MDRAKNQCAANYSQTRIGRGPGDAQSGISVMCGSRAVKTSYAMARDLAAALNPGGYCPFRNCWNRPGEY